MCKETRNENFVYTNVSYFWLEGYLLKHNFPSYLSTHLVTLSTYSRVFLKRFAWTVLVPFEEMNCRQSDVHASQTPQKGFRGTQRTLIKKCFKPNKNSLTCSNSFWIMIIIITITCITWNHLSNFGGLARISHKERKLRGLGIHSQERNVKERLPTPAFPIRA